MNEPVIASAGLTKHYQQGSATIHVLENIDFVLPAGESAAIVGPSGAGKSTFLHVLSGLDTPMSGKILIEGQDLGALSEKQRCILRNKTFGFIYQFHHLLPEFTALENVAMPLLVAGIPVNTARERAGEMLDQVGLHDRYQHKLPELSGGERQRVAIARACVNKPKLLFADEPTGNLDHHTAEQVFTHLLNLNQTLGTSLLVVTHDLRLAERLDHVLHLEEGCLQSVKNEMTRVK